MRPPRVTGGMEVLLAGEAALAHPGGAERFAVELLEALGRRHRVRALVLGEPAAVDGWRRLAPGIDIRAVAPPRGDGGGAWAGRRLRVERVRAAVAEALAREPADVVVGQLYPGAGALAAASAARTPTALLLAGYETLCHWAFAAGSRCVPASRCRRCPRALALAPAERAELQALRRAQDVALATAACLVAPSAAMAAACQRIAGRRPHVAAPVTRLCPPANGRPGGHALLVSSVWSREKGVDLLAPIARRLAPRPVVVQAPNGLPESARRALATLPNVSLRSRPSEIGPLLAGAGTVLVPSQSEEPFGRVAFEAMGAGIPVLASDAGGLAELVPEAQRVRRRDDPAAWSAAVRRLEPPGAWMAASRAGRSAAREVLAGDPVGRIEQLLEAAVQRARRPAAGASIA